MLLALLRVLGSVFVQNGLNLQNGQEISGFRRERASCAYQMIRGIGVFRHFDRKRMRCSESGVGHAITRDYAIQLFICR